MVDRMAVVFMPRPLSSETRLEVFVTARFSRHVTLNTKSLMHAMADKYQIEDLDKEPAWVKFTKCRCQRSAF
jgi:hypothetical protein